MRIDIGKFLISFLTQDYEHVTYELHTAYNIHWHFSVIPKIFQNCFYVRSSGIVEYLILIILNNLIFTNFSIFKLYPKFIYFFQFPFTKVGRIFCNATVLQFTNLFHSTVPGRMAVVLLIAQHGVREWKQNSALCFRLQTELSVNRRIPEPSYYSMYVVDVAICLTNSSFSFYNSTPPVC